MGDAQTSSNGARAADETPLKELQERLAPKLEEAQQQLSTLNERVKTFIRENPGTTLLGAAAVGYLLGRWASRK
ncbi:MAG: hypothetical protein JNG84_08095 [Archangium sp.]|nr:hypothetical protein [Archangium sp.]